MNINPLLHYQFNSIRNIPIATSPKSCDLFLFLVKPISKRNDRNNAKHTKKWSDNLFSQKDNSGQIRSLHRQKREETTFTPTGNNSIMPHYLNGVREVVNSYVQVIFKMITNL